LALGPFAHWINACILVGNVVEVVLVFAMRTRDHDKDTLMK